PGGGAAARSARGAATRGGRQGDPPPRGGRAAPAGAPGRDRGRRPPPAKVRGGGGLGGPDTELANHLAHRPVGNAGPSRRFLSASALGEEIADVALAKLHLRRWQR